MKTNHDQQFVTPYAGVWIETYYFKLSYNLLLSHPMRVCGLKLRIREHNINSRRVTPYAGVWIETHPRIRFRVCYIVTPYAGVWIETQANANNASAALSHPMRVCGLKLTFAFFSKLQFVTPYAGVWIETQTIGKYTTSLLGHTLCGCVD